MGIKHKTPKAPGEEGFAAEWNDEHLIDSDINFNFFSGINVGEPINPSDIATKNYVDTQGVGGIADYGQSQFSEIDLSSSYHDAPGGSVTVSVASGQKVLIIASCSPYIYTENHGYVWIQLRRNSTDLSGTEKRAGQEYGGGPGPLNIHTLSTQYLDIPGSGTFTYKARIRGQSSGDNNVWYGLITVIVFG